MCKSWLFQILFYAVKFTYRIRYNQYAFKVNDIDMERTISIAIPIPIPIAIAKKNIADDASDAAAFGSGSKSQSKGGGAGRYKSMALTYGQKWYLRNGHDLHIPEPIAGKIYPKFLERRFDSDYKIADHPSGSEEDAFDEEFGSDSGNGILTKSMPSWRRVSSSWAVLMPRILRGALTP